MSILDILLADAAALGTELAIEELPKLRLLAVVLADVIAQKETLGDGAARAEVLAGEAVADAIEDARFPRRNEVPPPPRT